MKQELLREFTFGNLRVIYLKDEEGHVSMQLLPSGEDTAKSPFKVPDPEGWLYSESLVHIRLLGDAACGGFAAGLTMRGSQTTENLVFVRQSMEEDSDRTRVITVLEDRRRSGLEAKHILEYHSGAGGFRVYTEVCNKGVQDLCMELLTTFSLVGKSINETDLLANPDRYKVHRFRSRWSAEGREETRSLQELLLEKSWSGWGIYSERFGCIGSLPVRSYFPYIALEDTKENTIIAAMLGGAYSWQMELSRRDANLCISGGIADYECGHWRKVLRPSESMRTPDAWLTVLHIAESEREKQLGTGSCLNDQAAQHLTHSYDQEACTAASPLPVLFNEFCTSWGYPTEQEIADLTEQLRGKGIDDLVIDAGWYADANGNWQGNQGDWELNRKQFPGGMKKTAENIQKTGMHAGIWFEAEVVGPDAKIRQEESHLLKREGRTIVSGERRFWDMRDPWVMDYLNKKIIRYLSENGFKYLKIDYNESIGAGCDSCASQMDGPGEGLRQNIEATQRFFRKIRDELPGISIEICASGGHRLVPDMINLADYLSFSDAHEEKEIPLIAASLQRLVPPRKMQIWAVIRKTDDRQRIVYSLISAMYGVLCLSGDALDLSQQQWDVIEEGIEFYRQISPVIAQGMTYFPFAQPGSFRTPEGIYATVRVSEDRRQVLVIIHALRISGAEDVSIHLPGTDYQILRRFEADSHTAERRNGELTVRMERSWDAAAYLLSR